MRWPAVKWASSPTLRPNKKAPLVRRGLSWRLQADENVAEACGQNFSERAPRRTSAVNELDELPDELDVPCPTYDVDELPCDPKS